MMTPKKKSDDAVEIYVTDKSKRFKIKPWLVVAIICLLIIGIVVITSSWNLPWLGGCNHTAITPKDLKK